MTGETDIAQRFIDLADAEVRPPIWVIRDTLPVGLVLLAGPPKKSYKSTLSYILGCLCAGMACRALPRWMAPDHDGPAMYVSAEADAGEVLYTIEHGLGLQVPRGHLYVAHDTWEFQLDVDDKGNQLLQDITARDPRIVALDPFRNLWSGDENDSGEVIKVLRPLRAWAHETQSCVLAVHHINKPPPQGADITSTAGMYTMRGSSAIPGLADGILVIEPTNTEGQITINATFKRGASWRRRIQMGVPGFGWPSEGYEVLPGSALALREMWNTEEHDMTFLEKATGTLKANAGTVKHLFESLIRNDLVTMSRIEQGMFLHGVRP